MCMDFDSDCVVSWSLSIYYFGHLTYNIKDSEDLAESDVILTVIKFQPDWIKTNIFYVLCNQEKGIRDVC